MFLRFITSIIGFVTLLLKRMKTFLDYIRVYLSPKVVSIQIAGQKIKFNNSGKDSLTRTLILENGQWEVNEIHLFSVLCKGAGTFFDIGANIGLYSILAEKCNPEIITYSFEPAPANTTRLLDNFKLNDIKKCTLIQKAVGDKNGKVSFFVPADNSSSSVSSTSEIFTSSWHTKPVELEVPLVTLDTFIINTKIQKVDLIKLDAEYYELNVLRGAIDLFHKYKPSVLCEVNIYEVMTYYFPDMKDKVSKNLSYDIEKFFKDINYSIYSIGMEGIMRTESVHIYPDVRNFLFSPVKSEKLFIPFSDESNIINLIYNRKM